MLGLNEGVVDSSLPPRGWWVCWGVVWTGAVLGEPRVLAEMGPEQASPQYICRTNDPFRLSFRANVRLAWR